MLKKLLHLIAEAGSADSINLARNLGVAPAMMQSMLATLTRQGYLKIVVTETSSACGRCPIRQGCFSGGKACLWTLSEKGVRVLKP